MSKHILDAHAGQGGGAVLTQAGGHSLAQPADDVVLLHSDDMPGLLRGLYDQLLVQGLYRVHIDKPGVYALGRQRIHGLYCLAHHQPGGNNGDIRALPQGDTLANLKAVVVVIIAALHRQTAQPEVHRALILHGGLYGGFHFVVVGRV